MPITPETLEQALHWRYAVKAFDPTRRIPADTWAALEQSLVLSPSSYGLQPWKFLVIRDQTLRQQLRPHSWDQSQITDCAELVVFLGRRTIEQADVDTLISTTCQTRGLASEQLAFYADLLRRNVVEHEQVPAAEIAGWNGRQVYIALGTFMAAAALLGVDTCPIEGFDPAAYDRILGLEEGPYRSWVVCAAGYRADDDKYAQLAKVRYPASELIEVR
ncbi:MAG: NAD(P)H-dependent oxidoreductase [Synechococcaceae bacterium WB9_2_112]|nr:NAD(P)H-dependent oxidoreductase [Synechococcaceae bacterium WB9_2_112]